MEKLFGLSTEIKKHGINLILVQIDEAHSNAWPMSIHTLLNVEPATPHKSFEDRVKRAQYFVDNYKPPYNVFVDGWNNEFAELFKAWPDRYYCVNKDFELIQKSEYHKNGDKEAVVKTDITVLLEQLMKL